MATPAATIDPESPVFESPDAAASAIAPKLSDAGKEFAGVLFQNPDGKYQYSTRVQGDHDNFALAAKIPKGFKLAGVVHSHPGDDEWGQMFSPNDLQTANQLKVPSYVHFLKTGSVRKYTPGSTATRKVQKPGQRDWLNVADGDPLPQAAPPVAPDQPGLLSKAADVNVSGSEITGASLATTDTLSPNLSTAASVPSPLVSYQPRTGTATAGASNNAPDISSLQSKMPSSIPQSSTVLAPSTSPAQATNATLKSGANADNATSQSYAAGQIGAQDSTNADAQLNAITSENSPYMQLARQQGMLTAASRGLQNSSIAAGSSEAAAVAAAAPLAEQNASEASTANQQNAAMGTQVSEQNAQLGTQANEFNTSEDVAQDQLNAQLGTQTSQFNTGQQQQAGEFNAQQQQQNSQANTQVSAAMESQVLQQNADLNKQYLSGTQAQDLASIQGQYNQLISTNQAASNLYQSYLQSIGTAMANKDIDPGRIAQDIQAQQAMLSSGLALINSMNGGNPIAGGTGATGAGTAPGMPSINGDNGNLNIGATGGLTPYQQAINGSAGPITFYNPNITPTYHKNTGAGDGSNVVQPTGPTGKK